MKRYYTAEQHRSENLTKVVGALRIRVSTREGEIKSALIQKPVLPGTHAGTRLERSRDAAVGIFNVSHTYYLYCRYNLRHIVSEFG